MADEVMGGIVMGLIAVCGVEGKKGRYHQVWEGVGSCV